MKCFSAGSACMLVLVVLAAVASPAFSRDLSGGARGLQASSTCVVSTSAKSWSINQISCKSAYGVAFVSAVKYFCENPNEPVPPTVTESIHAQATVIATAVATSAAKVSMTATISPSCEVGSYSYFDAYVRAKAMARSVAQSYLSALVQVIGQSAFNAVYADVLAISNALAATCETKYLSVYKYHQCTKGSCTASNCPNPVSDATVYCTYDDTTFVTATAEAVATAIVDAEATVETYYNTEECDDACEIALCGYVCPDGC